MANSISKSKPLRSSQRIIGVMLTQKQAEFVREELKTAKNPLFIHDDDADGLCSFLLLYRMIREGKGHISKTSPYLDSRTVRKVEELNPDKIIVLDIPIVAQEFIDAVKRPIFWIDHHKPLERKNIHYYNPRIENPDAYIPTTRMAYQVSQNPDDIWIAAAGCLADWHMPDFIGQFIEKYPQFLPAKTDLPTAVYQQPMGRLVKLFFFILKGPSGEVRKSIKILTRIKDPDEIFQQKTPQGRFLYKRFEEINQRYEVILKDAQKAVTKSKILLYRYTEDQWSFTVNLANELTNLYPQKVIIIARKKANEFKCSLRAHFPIDKVLEKALVGIKGYGGGHPQACGATIKAEDWERFLKQFKEEVKAVSP